MNLILFFFFIVTSFVIVRIGAVAFHVTGIEWALAKFQALSCFTLTGFTTREAELIASHPSRRKIASLLMLLGNAGFVAVVATSVNSLRPPDALYDIEIPYLHLIISSRFFPWVNLALMVLFFFIGFLIIDKTKLLRKMTIWIRKRIQKKRSIQPVSFEEMVIASGGYGLLNIEIGKESSLLDKTIKETHLRSRGVEILVIQREGETITVPTGDIQIHLGDNLICFGQLDKVKKDLLGE